MRLPLTGKYTIRVAAGVRVPEQDWSGAARAPAALFLAPAAVPTRISGSLYFSRERVTLWVAEPGSNLCGNQASVVQQP